MIGLYIVLGIALLICLILLLRIKIFICYNDALTVYLRILFFKYQLVPQKSKKVGRKKKKKKQEATQSVAKEPKADKKEDSVTGKLWAMREILLYTIKKFLGKLHFKLIKLNIVVACDNAATTAIAYGAVTQGVSYLIETLDTISNVDISKRSEISIKSDFISQKPVFEGKIILYISVAKILCVGWHFLKKFITAKAGTEE